MRIFSSLAVATIVIAAAAFIPQPAAAERVCRQDCVGPVCQERCVETEGRKTVVTDAKRGVKEKVANTGEKKGARCRRRGVNEDPVLS